MTREISQRGCSRLLTEIAHRDVIERLLLTFLPQKTRTTSGKTIKATRQAPTATCNFAWSPPSALRVSRGSLRQIPMNMILVNVCLCPRTAFCLHHACQCTGRCRTFVFSFFPGLWVLLTGCTAIFHCMARMHLGEMLAGQNLSSSVCVHHIVYIIHDMYIGIYIACSNLIPND